MAHRNQLKCHFGHVGPWSVTWVNKETRGKIYDVEKCDNCGKTRKVNIRRVPKERRSRGKR